MKQTEPKPNLVNLAQLRDDSSRTVEVKFKEAVLKVTHRIEEDPTVGNEIARAQMRVRDDAKEAQKLDFRLAALPEGDSPEREAIQAEYAKLQSRLDPLENAITFNPRRVVCRKIVAQFTEWNLEVPLDFDLLFDSGIPTEALQSIYDLVISEPVVGNLN